MNAFKCKNGHVHELDFGPHMKMTCPSCDALVYKYAARHVVSSASDTGDDRVPLAAMTLKKPVSARAKAIVAAAAVVVAGVAAFGMSHDVFGMKAAAEVMVNLAKMPVSASNVAEAERAAPAAEAAAALDATSATADAGDVLASDQASTPSQVKTDFKEVEISDLKVLDIVEDGKGGHNIRFTFTLTNKGAPDTPYPDLVIRWKKSTAKNVILRADQYAHPSETFSKVTVTTELHKPPHARGIEMKISS